ncbi:MAG: HAMP domain-containing histidine kinase [Taibaiella sp.]|nr:HAMP domain-containing histidine kinase [Taibaiella sp.]
MSLGSYRNLWNKVTGSPEEFTMQNRAFNYVCIITFFILVFSLVFDLFIEQTIMSAVLGGLILLLSAMYYFSRYKQKYRASTIIFVLCNYGTLVLNYFVNEGINGPTLALFTITLVFTTIIVDPKFQPLLIVTHILLVTSILAIEYTNPAMVPATYPSRSARFLDWGSTCIITLTFLYGLTNFLRKHYDAKRRQADERADEIAAQHERILEQNQALEKLDDEKSKLFSIVSHDLKGPVNALQEFLYLLSEDALPKEDRIEIQAQLTEQTKYTSDLLDNLMAWARSQMKGMAPEIKPVNIAGLTADIIRNKMSTAQRKGISLINTVGIDAVAEGDAEMLRIVLRNLMNNAIKFTNEGGSVTVSTEEEGDDLLIVVTDTGVGIDPLRKQDLFTLRTKATFGTNNEKGAGLGLAMCKEFVEYQGGSIWYVSENGNGTSFYIALPKSTDTDRIEAPQLVTNKSQIKSTAR